MSVSRSQRVLMLVLCALVGALVVVLLSGRQTHGAAPNTPSQPFSGATMPPGLRAADFSLTDQHGQRVLLAHEQGRVVVLTFIHSRCHDACPLIVEQIKGALNTLPQSARGIAAIGVSVAPSEDTVASRRRFLVEHEMDGRLAFVNGPPAALRRVWKAYAIQPGAGPNAHSAFVILIDKHGIERIGFAADQLTPEALAHDVAALERERS